MVLAILKRYTLGNVPGGRQCRKVPKKSEWSCSWDVDAGADTSGFRATPVKSQSCARNAKVRAGTSQRSLKGLTDSMQKNKLLDVAQDVGQLRPDPRVVGPFLYEPKCFLQFLRRRRPRERRLVHLADALLG